MSEYKRPFKTLVPPSTGVEIVVEHIENDDYRSVLPNECAERMNDGIYDEARVAELESLTRWYTLAEKAPPENVPVLVRRSICRDFVTVCTRRFWGWAGPQNNLPNLIEATEMDFGPDAKYNHDWDEWRYLIVPEQVDER